MLLPVLPISIANEWTRTDWAIDSENKNSEQKYLVQISRYPVYISLIVKIEPNLKFFCTYICTYIQHDTSQIEVKYIMFKF
jgi:hypothetical protein